MGTTAPSSSDPSPAPSAAHRVKLPGFVAPTEEIGLGDLVKKATTRAGVRPCGGCARRAEAMNRWVVIGRRH